LVAKILDVVPATAPPENNESPENRYLIQFSEFARVDVPNAWKGYRNPVKYSSFEELGIDPSTLKWEPIPESASLPAPAVEAPAPKQTVGAITMAEAKKGLALTFNVPPECGAKARRRRGNLRSTKGPSGDSEACMLLGSLAYAQNASLL
jgi:hypothetical protein